METITSEKKALRAELQKGIGEAVAALKKTLPAGSEKADSLFLIETQWLDARKKSLHGTLSQEQFLLIENQVRERLLHLINELEAEDLQLLQPPPQKKKNPSSQGAAKAIAPQRKRYWLYVLLAILFGLLIWQGVLYFGSPNERPAIRAERAEGGVKQEEDEAMAEPEASPEEVDFAQGSKVVYRADFKNWPTNKKEYGLAQPATGWNKYEIEAYKNTWIGPDKKIELSSILPGDFLFEIWFNIQKGSNLSLITMLQDAGNDYSTMEYYVSFSSRPAFSISEGWIKDNFYATTTKEFVSGAPVPDAARASIQISGRNHLSIKRVGANVQFFLNDYRLAEASITQFPIRQFTISLAGESKISLMTVEGKVPN